MSTVDVDVRLDDVKARLTAFKHCFVTKELLGGEFYEAPMLRYLRDLKLRGTYVDVGAHIGNHSVAFLTACQAEALIAFEPRTETFELLRTNVERVQSGRQVTVLANAVMDETCVVRVVDGPAENTGQAKVQKDASAHVEAVSLDSMWWGGHPPVTLIKVDVEGNEPKVLLGAKKLIERDRPVLVLEAATMRELRPLQLLLSDFDYNVVGCFGETPTYVARPRKA